MRGHDLDTALVELFLDVLVELGINARHFIWLVRIGFIRSR